jgi:hydroxyacid-oxoacid transhydrogenase
MAEHRAETVFTWGATPIKFGVGALEEVGHDLRNLGVERVLILTDPGVAGTGIPESVREHADHAGIKAEIYADVHVEPTDESLRSAAEHAAGGDWDGFVAVGGGSAIDTAKAVNLLTNCPGELMDYVNPPIGEGRAPEGDLQPLLAVPTTAGTGAESTAVCIMDILDMELKTGISHPKLRPNYAIIDPLTTITMPPEVTAASGVDVLTHALESYTSRPFDARPRKAPEQRGAYCGANPISDLWCEHALRLVGRSLRRAVLNGDDLDARVDMALAATVAALGFGNAGVHIPHACGYPIAGRVHDYAPGGYPKDHAMVPHGQAVGSTAPATFRFTFPTSPERHLEAARLLAATDIDRRDRDVLPEVLTDLYRDIGMPRGVATFGYDSSDIDALVEGTLKQERLLVHAPRDATAEALHDIFEESMENY